MLDARASVVNIAVTNEEGAGTGSGFAIGTTDMVEYIVTNYHVSGGNAASTVFWGNYDSVGATPYLEFPDYDLCVLKLDTPIKGMKPLRLYDGDPASLAGEQVYALGFPGAADGAFVCGRGRLADDITITDGIVSAVKESYVGVDPNSAPAVTTMQTNAAINGGNSGGPMVDENGTVLGVNTFSVIADTNMNGAVCISELIPELDKAGIPYKASSNILYSGVLWIILAAAAAGAVFALWFFVLRKRLKRAKTVSLSDYLEKSDGILEYDRAIALIAPVAAQLCDMHRQGTARLAVYPQNMRVQIAAGKAVLHAGKAEQISGYSAPEQYKEFAQTGTFTDIYQLGAVLYRLLTGERLPDVMSRVENDTPVQQKIDALRLLPSSKQALKLAIAINPDIRITNGDQFFAAFHITPEMAALPMGLAKKEHKKLDRKKKKKIVVFSVVGAALAVVGVCAGLFFTAFYQTIGLLNDGDYKQAEQVSANLPDIGDASKLKRVAKAGVAVGESNFEEAWELLSGIENDSYAQIILSDIDFRQGVTMIAFGDAENGEALIKGYISANPDADQNMVDYARATAYRLNEDFETAINIFKELGDYSDAHAQAAYCAIAISGDKIAAGDITGAIILLEPYSDVPEVQSLFSNSEELVYQQGLDYLLQNFYDDALVCFSRTPGYQNADSYAAALSAQSYGALKPHLELPLLNNYLIFFLFQHPDELFEYLKGKWTASDNYFQMSSDYSVLSNLPMPSSGGEYEITAEGVLRSGGRNYFQFEVLDKNTIRLYAYANDNTYKLTRQ